MIVKTIQRNVVESHDFKSEIATIDASEMRYISSLLRNNYSDTILATVRETFANAIDANKAANSETPVRLIAPTRLSPTFLVRDFGAGLSESDLFGLYTKYGRSTKRENNTAIGGFGIGRFAPLSYTDSFTVSSFHNGTKIVISVYVDEHGDTRFTKLDESVSTERNGVEISVAVKADDISAFENRIARILYFCEEKFHAITAKIEKPEWIIKGKNWGVIKDSRYVGGDGSVVMGGISYPLNIDTLRQHPISNTAIFKNFSRSYVNQNFVFFFPVGSVSLHHSREALEYNANTKNYIAKAIESLGQDVTAEVQKELANLNDSKDFFAKLWEIGQHNTVNSLCADSEFNFTPKNGKIISVKNEEVEFETVFRLTDRTKNLKRCKRNGENYKLSPSEFYSGAANHFGVSFLLVDDGVRNISGRAYYLLINNPNSTVYVLSEADAKKKFLIDHTTFGSIHYASKITPITKKTSDFGNVRKVFDNSIYCNTFAEKIAEPTSEYYYLKLVTNDAFKAKNGRNFHVHFGEHNIDSYQIRQLQNFIRSSFKINIPMIYGVVDETQISDKAICLSEFFFEKFNPMFEKIKSVAEANHTASFYTQSLSTNQLDQLNLPETHIISQYLKKCEVADSIFNDNNCSKEEYNKFQSQCPEFLTNNFKSNFPKEKVDEILKEALTIKHKYPMLFCVLENRYVYRLDDSAVTMFSNYIELVDKSQS